jgi:hypothetical protein
MYSIGGDEMKRKRVTYVLIAVLMALALTMAIPVSAAPTADSFGVSDAMGNPGTVVSVPVNIENTQAGPIISLRFDISYDSSVITVASVQRGDLTSAWDPPAFNNFAWGTRVLINYNGFTGEIPNGSTGSVVILNFNVVGAGGSATYMNLSDIQLSDTAYNVGSAPAKDGQFRVDAGVPVVLNPSANPTTINADGVEETELNVTAYDDIAIDNVTVDLTQIGGPAAKVMEKTDGTLYSTTTTVSPGTAPGTYYLPINATDLLGNANTTETFALTIEAPATGTVSGTITKACDDTGLEGVTVNLTQDSTVVASTTTDSNGNFTFTGVNSGDYSVNASKSRYWNNSTAVTVSGGGTATADMLLWMKGDLNDNCIQADAGDLAKMKDASVGKIDSDWRFDLNDNDINADAGDLAKMKDASVGKIELL